VLKPAIFNNLIFSQNTPLLMLLSEWSQDWVPDEVYTLKMAN
jgi:hypothetical protein